MLIETLSWLMVVELMNVSRIFTEIKLLSKHGTLKKRTYKK